MLARLQQFLVFALLLISALWAAAFTLSGHPAWGMAMAALILLGYALFLGVEFVALYIVQESSPAPRPTVLQLLGAWVQEVITAPRVFFWRQPFRSRAEPDSLPDERGTQRGVVLVHGFVCNRGLWNPWMRALRSRKLPYIAVNLEPLFGSVDNYAEIIEAAVTRMERATGQSVLLVGHSMGGLAIRAWLRRHHGDARVHRAITIGTPHHGTWLARFGRTENGIQMRQRGPWLTQLGAEEPVGRFTNFTCFYGHCDNIVFPASAGMLPGALNVHVPGTAHVHMAFQPVVFKEVCRWLDSPPGSSAPARDAAAR